MFECEKHSDIRYFIIQQLNKLKQFDSSIATHPLFNIINDWYSNQEDQCHDTDLLDLLLRCFMAPIATAGECQLSPHHSKIIRSLFINLCAMTVPTIRPLLSPLHWHSISGDDLIDLEDSKLHKQISLRINSSHTVTLFDTSIHHLKQTNSMFPVF